MTHKINTPNILQYLKTYINKPFKESGYLNGKHFKNLDGIRGIAILIVLIAHQQFTDEIPTELKSYIRFIFQDGKLGVGIFFVLSGFLITSLLIKEKIKFGSINLKLFYLRRLLRIGPAYLFFIGLIALLNYTYSMGISALTFTGVILYLYNFKLFQETFVFAHTWSLAVEEQYYLIWPFIFNTLKKYLLSICFIIILFNPFIRIFVYKFPMYDNILLRPFFNLSEPIIVGSLIAILHAKGLISPIKSAIKTYLVIGFSFFIFWLCYYFSYKGELGILLLPFGTTISEFAIGICIYLLCSPVSTNFLETKILMFLGRISYSLYLWQQLFVFGQKTYGFKAYWTIFPYNIFWIFATACISYYFIEKPFLNIKNKLRAAR